MIYVWGDGGDYVSIVGGKEIVIGGEGKWNGGSRNLELGVIGNYGDIWILVVVVV